MKDIKNVLPTYYSAINKLPKGKVEVSQDVIQLVNEISKRFEGIYQYTGNRTQEKMNLYKRELTRALYLVNDKISKKQVNDAIDFFAINGGTFAPSVPDFIQAVLGNHKEMIKSPEHVWFDSAKALPQHTPSQYQDYGKKGMAIVREMLNKSRH